MLLERAPELAQLDEALTAMRGGIGGAALIQGPAGIGKTQLLLRTAQLAADEGALRLTARGGELERDFAFGVARQLLEPALLEMPATDRGTVLEGAAALAAPVIGLAPAPDAPVRGDRLFAVTHGLYWACANLAARQPLVIEVDDVQWADEPSLSWLLYLARRVGGLPILVLLAARTDERAAVSAPMGALSAEPTTTLVAPRPLSIDATAAVIADVTGVEPVAEVAAAVQERSAGVPFVVHELATALAHARLAPDAPDAAAKIAGVLPESVARSVVHRLSRLSGDAVALARAVAVLGTDVHLADAARLAALGERAAADALDELIAAGLVTRDAPLRFAHPLTREAIYEEMPAGQRMLDHRRAARVLQARIEPERIAAHLLECEPGGDADSVALLRQCAERALARGAPRAAVRYLQRALDEGPGPDVRTPLLCELGAAEARTGRPEAVAHLEQALATAATPSQTAGATSELAIALSTVGRMPDAVDALERGIAALRGRAHPPTAGADTGDRELELRLEGELGAIGQLTVAAAPRVSERLRRVAPDLAGTTPSERLVLASYAFLRSSELAPAAELVALAERALGDGALLREQTADAPAFYMLIYVLYRAGRLDLGEHWLTVALDEARARGSLLGTSIALAVRSHLRWLRGDLTDAAADAQTSLDAQIEAGWGAAVPLAVAVRADCLLEDGDVQAARRLFADAGLDGELPDMHMFRWTQATRGRTRIAAGLRDEGIADLLGCARELGPRASIAMLWRTDVAPALAARGEDDRARALAEEQLALARDGDEPRSLGVALRVLGLLSNGDDAVALLSESVEVLDGASARLEQARALVDLGATIRRGGRRAAARDHLKAGYELARACGSTVLAERAAAELASSGVRMRRPALSGADALTPSERRVAELAARGLSNPEIAQTLFVTRKTVEMHLGNVYRKLGVSGRDELPAGLGSDGQPALVA